MPRTIELPEHRVQKITYSNMLSTRQGRSISLQPTQPHQPIILVDKREFKSLLPSVLYHKGFKIVPIQLERGD